ncbi:methylenetetrahydrofolate reductase [Acrocarpospora phusangensis]|uniref:Methylenetetrahydrofolate reductase n=1 Tax=Acrocarpospora phusangensis TaxID=1070424 RepID=A0A919Q874_9ACTN|nr:methylenetetrahydrofolate reductase [Acrocarpospora phusangensis]GIH23996.1 methylenetetrahydrofolate reductase [Acrocarpospora phusangensis]
MPLPSVAAPALAQALNTVSYEILPLRSAEESVLAHVPRTIPLTITTTEAKGLAPTLDLARRLAGSGYSVSPHLAARLVRDKRELADIVGQLREAGVDSVFVIAGDAAEPAGCFPDSLALLEVLEVNGHHFRRIGIAGYPEGHAGISRELIDRALERKAGHATHVITQMCFDAATTAAWARGLKARGIGLPIHVGLPGAVNRQRLIRISAGLGLGQSARFLRKQRGLLWRFLLPGGYRPDRLAVRLAPRIPDPGDEIRGFHLFTFNELERTEAWRRALLARITDLEHR